MKQIRIGKILLTNGGTWDAATGYPILTYVLHNGDGWWSAKANVNSEPSASNRNWVQATDVQPLVALMRAETESAHDINEAMKAAEQIRANAESARALAENSRGAAEQARQSAESGRVAAENSRVQEEIQRKSNEVQRQNADLNRQQQHAQAMANVEAATELASSKAAEAQAAAEAASATDTQVKAHEQAREDAERTREAQEAQRSATFQQNEQQRSEEFASKEEQRDAAISSVTGFEGAVGDIQRDFGKYAQLPDVTLEVVLSGKRFASDGSMVDDSNWNIGRLGSVERGLLYELKMGGSDKMVLGTALFVSHTIEKRGSADVDVYTPVFSALGVDLPVSNYAVLWAGENYTDLLVSYRNDVAGANVMKVASWGIFKSIATQYANLRARVDLKSFADGYYASMRVGTADNLTPRGESSEETFMERIAGGTHSIEDGDAAIKTIKGKTLKVVKLDVNFGILTVKNGGITYTVNHDKATASGTRETGDNNYYTSYSGVPSKVISGHKYLFKSSHKNLSLYLKQAVTIYNDNSCFIATANASGNVATNIRVIGLNVGDAIDAKDVTFEIFDLTAMFGAGNEPATPQAFAEALGYPSIEAVPYVPYTEGKLVPSKVEGVKTTGRNLWDEEWKLGSLDGEGKEFPSVTQIISNGYIPISDTFYCKTPTEKGAAISVVCFYDGSKNFISRLTSQFEFANKLVSAPVGAKYIRIRIDSATTYAGGVCISIPDASFNGQYEPYEVHERKWGETMRKYFPDGLKSAGNVYDEITPTKAIKRVGVVDMGTLNWKLTQNIFYCKFTDTPSTIGTHIANIICPKYETVTWNSMQTTSNDKCISKFFAFENGFNVKDYAYTDAAALKAALQGVMLYYELATPEEYTYDELNLTERVFAGGMESAIVPEGEESAPLVADIVYPIDAYNTIKSNKQHIEAMQPVVAATKVTADAAAEQNKADMAAWQLLIADKLGIAADKVGCVDMGGLSWSRNADGLFYATIADGSATSNSNKLLCTKYAAVDNRVTLRDTDKTIMWKVSYYTSSNQVFVHDGSYTDASALANSLKGIYLFHEKA